MQTLRLTGLMYSVQPPRIGANTSVVSVSTDVIPAGYTAIYTVDDLNNVRNKLDGKYILMNDIDLSSVDNWDPIGTNSAEFTGTFDGNGHVIKNLTINYETEINIGFFGRTQNATIKNLGLNNANITGYLSVGTLVGVANGGTITNCYTSGQVSGDGYIGGLTGNIVAGTTVANCYSTANINGMSHVGGLSGTLGGIISNCYFAGNISVKEVEVSGLLFGEIDNKNSQITNTCADKKDSTLSALDKF